VRRRESIASATREMVRMSTLSRHAVHRAVRRTVGDSRTGSVP